MVKTLFNSRFVFWNFGIKFNMQNQRTIAHIGKNHLE